MFVKIIQVVREDLGVQDAMFVRIQSSLCERGAYDKILMETDHNLLLHLGEYGLSLVGWITATPPLLMAFDRFKRKLLDLIVLCSHG